MNDSRVIRSVARALTTVALLTQTGTLLAITAVPGTSDLWLAGMPNGTTASLDVAPAQSPKLVTEIAVVPGAAYSFSATGLVRNGPNPTVFVGPDGDFVIPHEFGVENGIAVLTAPLNSLIGVFLGAFQPNLSVAPAGLDFTTTASRNYLTLAPALKQPFFIGNGLTSTAAVQTITAPAGATRLFLGTQDGSGWYNNEGSFQVAVAPEPGSIALLATSCATLMWRSRWRNVHLRRERLV